LSRSATPRFPSPLIKPDVRISCIRFSDRLHRRAHGGRPILAGVSLHTMAYTHLHLATELVPTRPNLNGVHRLIANHRSFASSQTCQKSGSFAPPALPSINTRTTLSNSRLACRAYHGIRFVTFEACSGFTRITARRIAQPSKATFVTRLQPGRLPVQAARQLPDLSTTIRVEPSSTGDPRLRGALPFSDI